MQKPFKGDFKITSPFGWRISPVGRASREFHDGVDFATPIGTPILASHDGKVIVATFSSLYGNYIIIEKGNLKTRYSHLKTIFVNKNQKVKEGQKIAESGNTGRSSGAHLDFAVFIDNKATDPIPFLKNTNNNMKNYLEVNKKIIEDFTKHHSDVFGSRTADYIHLETKTRGAGIRERFNVLIKEIRNLRGREIPNCDSIQKELEKAKEENEILIGDIVNNINACNIDKADLNDKIQILQELNGKWARDFDEELEKAKKEFIKNYIPEIIQTKETFDFNQLFIGISRWWTSQGGFDLVLGGVLSVLIVILPSIFEELPPDIVYTSILPLLNSLVATFRKNSSKQVIQKYEPQIDKIESIANNKIK
jgi:hypothetical protein